MWPRIVFGRVENLSRSPADIQYVPQIFGDPRRSAGNPLFSGNRFGGQVRDFGLIELIHVMHEFLLCQRVGKL